MKVCMVVPDFDRVGGYEKQAFSLSKDLKKRGKEVFILTNKKWEEQPSLEVREGVTIYRISGFPKFFGSHYLGTLNSIVLFFWYNQKHIQIVHAHALTHFAVLCIFVGKVLGKKGLIKIATEEDITKIMASSSLIQKLLIPFSKFTNYYIAISENIKKEIIRMGVPKEKIYSSFNGVDTNLYKPLNLKDKIAKRRFLAIPNEEIVTFVGRLAFRKGVDVLIKAWKKVIHRFPHAFLLIIGSGEEENDLKGLAKNLNLIGNIKFVGMVENVVVYLQISDIFSFPSRLEGSPNAILEALACGLPIIGTKIGGIVDIINHGENGLLVPPENTDLLAKNICQLLQDKEYRESLGQRARESALSRFSFEVVSRGYLECYRKLVKLS
jgi:glycosyltransferase involved in cell wall biosynthesis